MTADPDDDTLCCTLADAEHAHDGMIALQELLGGCPREHQITAGPFLELVSLVNANLANAVDGLRAMVGRGSPA